jgi:class 3 adenylate cyclase
VSADDLSQDPFFVDLKKLVDFARTLGASEEDVEVAGRVFGLGPLTLDLALRPPGPVTTLAELAADRALDPDLVQRIWLACGFPEVTPFPFPVTPDLARAIAFLCAVSQLLGEEAAFGFLRVVGASVAKMAEGLAGLTRVHMELPQLSTGKSYSALAQDTAAFASQQLPPLLDAISALFRRHVILVAYQYWAPDPERTAVTLQLTVGFADLVGSTQAMLGVPVSRIAAMVERFERETWDVVAKAGGRLVKLIGDEAMFVHEDPTKACRIAEQLIALSPEPIKVGLAHGPVVALHGDYYGPTVNLAARLVSVAHPSTVVVSDNLPQWADTLAFTSIEVGPLRGFPDGVRAYQLGSERGEAST